MALHLYFICSRDFANLPTAGLPTIRHTILAPGETFGANGEITVWWKNVLPTNSGSIFLATDIKIYSFDSYNQRHETTYNLFVLPFSSHEMISNEIMPRVSLTMRRTKLISVKCLDLIRK
jgi:hypothetical protein